MKFILGKNRATYRLTDPLKELILPDNVVLRIDLFVDNLDLAPLGFKMVFSENGRPAYHPKVLLKRRVIESVNDLLMSVMNIDHNSHGSSINAVVRLMVGLIAYSYYPDKPHAILEEMLGLIPNSR